MAIAEFAHPLRQAIDAHVVGDLVEVSVGRLLQRFGDVQMAVAPLFPVAVAFIRAGKLPPAGVKQAGVAGNNPGAERRDGHVWLNRRRRWVNALSRAVNQRRIGIVEESGVVFAGNTVNEQVGIVAWRRDQREDCASARVGDYDRRAAAGQQRFNVLL